MAEVMAYERRFGKPPNVGLHLSTICGYDDCMSITSSQLADAIGRKQMAKLLGVGDTAVSNAVVRGWFPSSWFLVCKDLAKQVGAECPPALFKMREPDNTQNVDQALTISGSGIPYPDAVAK